MLPKILIAACLISASGSALAIDEFISRHGIRVEPHVSITLGSGHHNVYRDTRHHDVYVPRPVHVQPVYNNYYYRQDGGRHHWKNKDRHHRGWRDYDRDDHHDRRRHHEDEHDD